MRARAALRVVHDGPHEDDEQVRTQGAALPDPYLLVVPGALNPVKDDREWRMGIEAADCRSKLGRDSEAFEGCNKGSLFDLVERLGPVQEKSVQCFPTSLCPLVQAADDVDGVACAAERPIAEVKVGEVGLQASHGPGFDQVGVYFVDDAEEGYGPVVV